MSDKSGQTQKIVVRAFQGRPVQMECRAVGGGRVHVARTGGKETLSMPKEAVFEYTAALLKNLEAAWKSGNERLLETLWSSARNAFP
jgi:hypothetical protein